ncbi:thermonuclease family protein [Porticoccus sp.]
MRKPIIFLSAVLLSITVYADFTGTVVNVTDGDAVNVLEAGNVLHKVRLTGIDAPERG